MGVFHLFYFINYSRVLNSVQQKPLFWFRSHAKTDTQNCRYFRVDIVTNSNEEILLPIVWVRLG
jgi:hypothetical protein